MIEIEKKNFEAIVDEIITTKDLRLIIEKSLINHHHYRSIILDISKGSKSRNFRIIREISKNKKVSERFIVDQAKSVISFFNPGDEADLEDYYKILECSQESDDEDIRNNWIRLMKLYHPDKIGEPGLEKTKKINEAYNILIDPVSREQFDKSYFPDILVRIKNLDYIQFKNRRFLAVMASLLLLIPVFYIYKSFTSSELNTQYSEKPDDKIVLNNNSNNKSTNAKSDNEEIVDNADNISTKVDNSISKENDLISLREEKYPDSTDQTPIVRDVDEIESEAIVLKENEIDDLEFNTADSIDNVDDYVVTSVKIENDQSEQNVYAKDENDVKNEIKLDIEYDNPEPEEPQNYIVKKGGSLWSLSNKFDIPINEIKKRNSLNRNTIKPGDNLILSKTDKNTGTDKLSKIQVASGIDKNLEDSTNNMAVASKKHVIDEAKTINNKQKIKKMKPVKVRNVEGLDLSALKANGLNTPNKSSIYTAISDYIFAYKNRDIKKLGTLFDVNAKENGVAIDKVFKKYRKNFEVLDIVAYDIKFNKVNLDKRIATVDGDFIISYTNMSDHVFKKSYGDINWKLTWNDKNWLINEIRYNVTNTKVEDDFNK